MRLTANNSWIPQLCAKYSVIGHRSPIPEVKLHVQKCVNITRIEYKLVISIDHVPKYKYIVSKLLVKP